MSYDGIFYYNSCFFYIFFCYGINHAVPLFPDRYRRVRQQQKLPYSDAEERDRTGGKG